MCESVSLHLLEPMLHETPEALDEHEFMLFVGHGQASLLHLAEFIHITYKVISVSGTAVEMVRINANPRFT